MAHVYERITWKLSVFCLFVIPKTLFQSNANQQTLWLGLAGINNEGGSKQLTMALGDQSKGERLSRLVNTDPVAFAFDLRLVQLC